ncbi:MAG: type II toxin-antitoxin system RelE/ParE family toxin [Cytophagales bacterium]|nr:type II toxin-antitoxin system RelE/ParE family toxin [Cytophagales bacterium]
MLVYSLSFSKQAFKELSKINEPYYSNIKSAIIDLSLNPRPNGYKKLKGRDGFRIRVGVYRIIYSVKDQELTIEIITIGHRKEVYD